MTVTYTAEVATCRGFGCFWKLLFRWRGSIYKLLWPELSVYIVFYYTLSAVYRFALHEQEKRYFEKIARYCDIYADLIPVTFILGFYISIVLKRWWDQFVSIPWPDPLALFVSASIHGQDDRGRLMRRTIMRYVNLSLVMSLTCISPRVKKRFPTLEHLQEAGILLPNEKVIIEDLNKKTPQYPKYWMPLVWASSVVTRARKEGRIRDDFAVKTLIDELCSFRGQCGGLFIYDWISIPLVYTQVVTLAVYTFFFATMMGRQYLDPDQEYPKQEIDLYVPIFTFLQFFFYMGWLKVAETLVNPFGEDDDDFEMNWLIDRNIQVSYLIVDEIHQEHPELIKDQYWDEVMPQELPYTAATEQYRRDPPKGSAADISVPDHEAEFLPMETVTEEQANGHLFSSKVSLPLYGCASQASSCSQLETNNLRTARNRPSMLSVIQRLFTRESTQTMGSSLSLATNRKTANGKVFGSRSSSTSIGGKSINNEDDDDDGSVLSFTVRNRLNSIASQKECGEMRNSVFNLTEPEKREVKGNGFVQAEFVNIEPLPVNDLPYHQSGQSTLVNSKRSHWSNFLDKILPLGPSKAMKKSMRRIEASQSQPNIPTRSNDTLDNYRHYASLAASNASIVDNQPHRSKLWARCNVVNRGLLKHNVVELGDQPPRKKVKALSDVERNYARRNSAVGELEAIQEKRESLNSASNSDFDQQLVNVSSPCAMEETGNVLESPEKEICLRTSIV